MLGLGLGHLLVTEGLLGGVRLRLGLQPLDHLGDEVLDLSEGVGGAGLSAHARSSIQPACQLLQGHGLRLAGEVAHHADHVQLPRHTRGLPPAPELEQRDLVQGIGGLRSAGGGLRDNLLRLGDDLELLLALLGLCLVVRSASHAVVLHVLERLAVRGELVRGRRERALRDGLLLAVLSDAVLRLGQVLLGQPGLVLQGLLQELESVQVLGLALPRLVQLPLGLVLHVAERLHDTLAVALVGRGLRGPQAQVLVTCRGVGSLSSASAVAGQ